MIRRPPRSTLFPYTSSSDLPRLLAVARGDQHAGLCRGALGLVEDAHLVVEQPHRLDRKSTRLNSSHLVISYAVFCLNKKAEHRVTLHTTHPNVHVRYLIVCA